MEGTTTSLTVTEDLNCSVTQNGVPHFTVGNNIVIAKRSFQKGDFIGWYTPSTKRPLVLLGNDLCMAKRASRGENSNAYLGLTENVACVADGQIVYTSYIGVFASADIPVDTEIVISYNRCVDVKDKAKRKAMYEFDSADEMLDDNTDEEDGDVYEEEDSFSSEGEESDSEDEECDTEEEKPKKRKLDN